MIYDAAIIGTGPAGLSAALNLKIHEKNLLWIGSRRFSDKVEKAEQILNYPGFHAVSGPALNEAFRSQAEAMGLTVTDAMVNSIMDMGTHYALMAGPEFYEARTVLLATGVAAVGTLPGESDLVGLGVSYCATCDGSLYRGKTIAVVCTNPRFEHEVAYLAGLAKTVHYFPTYKNVGSLPENVILSANKPKAVVGQGRVSGLELRGGEILEVDGLFCLRDAVSLATLLPGLAAESGHIAVDRAMATNLPGVFAAGDCTGRPYQYVKAAGEGNIAAHSIIEYLSK